MTKEEVTELFEQKGITPTERELEVVMLRFGLDQDGEPRTLDEVGEILGITRERVRQIENKLLRRGHSIRRAKAIKDFYA